MIVNALAADDREHLFRLSTGASSLAGDGTLSDLPQNVAPVGPLADLGDPLSWHPLHDPPPVAMRRARRIDAWQDGTSWWSTPCSATAAGIRTAPRWWCTNTGCSPRPTGSTGTLVSIDAQPRVLPYVECPLAAPNAQWLVGTPLRDSAGRSSTGSGVRTAAPI